ncbi:Piso0_003011 [Millerozyma farinosa CBS 7064]|uniref:Mitochondrial thiamine pyrophosphate carrier 1 n=1 Tax=Pichia sorbitophila (strain ATCC MYA-4447 / BCRC 22081 / CBS 7064 / NBRC 10061 / NRRL Y-12695) TaxID=559304 RepID=G8YK39_PICSO|nr:Piso0_003011 [Millerozyma farinosa CBS 7064]CCE80684.1 Piso0_003011 [Millerozyma farinosa CBS 7064]
MTKSDRLDPEKAGMQTDGVDKSFSDQVQGEEYVFNWRGDCLDQPGTSFSHARERWWNRRQEALSKITPGQSVTLAGAASGFLAGIVVCPLDVMKTRLQAQGTHGASYDQPKKQTGKGLINIFKTILREEGVRGLYRGVVPITIGYLPTWTIYFTVYERAKRIYPSLFMEYFGLHVDTLNHFCSAMTAGVASSIAVNPVWVVKTRLMIQTGQGRTIYDRNSPADVASKRTYYKGTLDAFRLMYKEEGFRVFYSGLVPSLFGLFHVGIHFPVYEKLKSLFACNIDAGEHDVRSKLTRLIAASALSKMVASTLTYPHEILRTRMQIQSSERKDSPKNGRLLSTLVGIYRKEGLRGFYAGYGVNLARTLPASAVTLVSFEYFKNYLLRITGNT